MSDTTRSNPEAADDSEDGSRATLSGDQSTDATAINEQPSGDDGRTSDIDGGPRGGQWGRPLAVLVAAVVLSLVVVSIAAALFGPALITQLGPTVEPINPRIAAAERRIEALETATAALAERPDPAPAMAIDDAALDTLAAEVATQLATVDTRLESLDTRLAALNADVEQRTGEVSASEAGVDGPAYEFIRDGLLANRQGLAAVQQQLAALESADDQSAAMAALEDKIAALMVLPDAVAGLGDLPGRVAALEVGPTARAESILTAAMMMVAVGELRVATAGAGPFETALASVRTAARDDAALVPIADQIADWAPTGVPTLQGLKQRFPTMSRRLTHAKARAESDGWLDDAVAEIGQLVTVRRVNVDDADASPGAILSRAEAHMSRGALAAAVAEIERLGVAGAQDPWLRDARARVALDQAVSALARAAIDQARAALG